MCKEYTFTSVYLLLLCSKVPAAEMEFQVLSKLSKELV
jgi:hypothetical protein